jgi:hypothetical protein
MRTLKFIVDGQIIKQDPNCDFSGLVPGTEGYLKAEFSFSPEWQGCSKIATFNSVLGKDYPKQLLKDGKTCTIPAEAVKKRTFEVGVVGTKQGFRITTNTVAVSQNGGRT